MTEFDLDEREYQRWTRLYSDYLRQFAIYQQVMKELGSFRLQIPSSVDRGLVEDIASHSTPISMLRKLQDRLCPTKEDRAIQAVKRYRNLMEGGRNRDPVGWVGDCMKVCQDLEKMEVIQAFLIKQDFLEANMRMDEAFTVAVKLQISDTTTFRDLALLFQRHYRAKAPSTDQALAFATPTLQGRPQKTPPTCLCGQIHWFKDCWYLIPSRRPASWQENPDIRS